MMNWLYKSFGFRGKSKWVYDQIPPETYELDIYQSPDKPWVFLGSGTVDPLPDGRQSGDYFAAAERYKQTFGHEPHCVVRIQVTDDDLPELENIVPATIHEPFPEHNHQWTDQQWNETWPMFQEKANQIANTIERNQSCMVYVHCTVGANRSPSILSAALSCITDKSVMELLREMRSQRVLVSPEDAYFVMALEFSKHPADKRMLEQARQNLTVPDEEITQQQQIFQETALPV